MRKRWQLKVAGAFLIIPIVIGGLGLITMGLWNEIVPALFHGPIITFWQSLGLLVLSHILLGGPGRFGGWRRNHWRGRFERRWEKMSPEEREKLRGEWGHRCGGRGWRGWPDKTGEDAGQSVPEATP